MTDIEFEQLMSYCPRTGQANFRKPPLRDMIYTYFKLMGFSEKEADIHTKEYIAELYKFVNKAV